MKKGKTPTGFSFSINEEVLKDYRFVKLLAKIDNLRDDEDSQVVFICSDLIKMLLGDDGENKLIKHVEKKGIASFEDVYKELGEILKAIQEQDTTVKN